MVPREIIERLYRTFKIYSSDTLDMYSPYNSQLTMEAWIKIMRSKPLRELTAEDLRYYTFKAMTTWGRVELFKHYLPRIFELISRLEWTGMHVEIVFGKLDYGHWKTWPQKEQDVINSFCTAFWQSLVEGEHPISDSQISTYVRSFLEARIDLQPLLDIWLRADSETAVRRLCHFIEQEESSILQKGRFGWSQKHKEENGAVLQQWLRSDTMNKHLSDSFFKYADTTSAELISRALQAVERTDYFKPQITFLDKI